MAHLNAWHELVTGLADYLNVDPDYLRGCFALIATFAVMQFAKHLGVHLYLAITPGEGSIE